VPWRVHLDLVLEEHLDARVHARTAPEERQSVGLGRLARRVLQGLGHARLLEQLGLVRARHIRGPPAPGVDLGRPHEHEIVDIILLTPLYFYFPEKQRL